MLIFLILVLLFIILFSYFLSRKVYKLLDKGNNGNTPMIMSVVVFVGSALVVGFILSVVTAYLFPFER